MLGLENAKPANEEDKESNKWKRYLQKVSTKRKIKYRNPRNVRTSLLLILHSKTTPASYLLIIICNFMYQADPRVFLNYLESFW